MKKLLCVFLAALVLPLGAWGQNLELQSVQGRFQKYDRSSVTLDTGTYVISPRFAKPVLTELSTAIVGQLVDLKLQESLVVEVKLDTEGFQVDVTFEDKIQVGDGFIIRFKEGAQFPVESSKIKDIGKSLFFVNRNIKVRATIVAGKIVRLEVKNASMGAPRLELKPSVKSVIDTVGVGATLKLNDVYFGKVTAKDEQSFTYQPLDGDGSAKGAEKWFAFGLIEKIEVITASTKSDNEPKKDPSGDGQTNRPEVVVQGNDAIAKLNLTLGDTIGIGLKKGVLKSLTGEKIGILIWDGEQFSESVEYERGSVAEKVRRSSLAADRQYKVDGGEIRVVSQRKRDQSKGVFRFDLRITHNLQDRILTRAELQAFRDPVRRKGAVGQAESLLPVFANEVFRWKKLVTIDDPLIEIALVIKPDSILKLDSEAAVRAIGVRLIQPEPGDRLRRTYEAAINNQDPELIAILVTHLMTDFPSEVKQQALAAFQLAGAQAPKLLIDILSDPGKSPTMVLPDDTGRPIKKAVKVSGSEYRSRALKLLEQYNAKIPYPEVERLIKLSEFYEGTADDKQYIRVLRRHIDSVCATVVDIASRPKPDEEIFKLGSDILRSQGEIALKPLLGLLRSRGLGAEAKKIAEQRGTQKPETLVQAAIEKVVLIQRQRALKTMRSELKAIASDMKAAKKVKEALDAIELWKKILARQQNLPQDKLFVLEILPEILANYGQQLFRAKHRGMALEMFRRGLKLIKDNRDSRHMAKSRRALRRGAGRIVLAALNEELSGVSVRQGPAFGYQPMRPAKEGDIFPVVQDKKPVESWFPCYVGKSIGWLPSTVVQKTKSGKGLRVTTGALQLDQLQKMLNEGRDLDPSNSELVNKVQAEIYSREIDQLMQENRHEEVLARISELQTIAPNHPALKKQYHAWFMVYWIFPALLGSLIVGALIFAFVHLLMNRQKKIKPTGQDYLYYGKDRSEIERTFE